MGNKISPEAIERFLNNQSDIQEAERVADYLKNVPPEILNQYLTDQEWQDDENMPDSHLPDSLREDRWADLADRVALYNKDKGRSVYLKRLVAAACLIGLLLCGYYRYSLRVESSMTDRREMVASVKIIKENKTTADESIKLPDGTGLILKPGSAITYYTPFKVNRDVSASGTVFFDVVHDSTHPFVVKSNGILVKDIGTKFWVESDETAQTVVVKLEEGLVLVQSTQRSFQMQDIFLKPGQKLVIDKMAATATVGAMKEITKVKTSVVNEGKKEAEPTGKTTWTTVAYSFSKTSLEEVFRKLALRYKIKIIVTDPEINQRRFTGKVMYSDSLTSLINVICRINNLSCTQSGDTIYIKK